MAPILKTIKKIITRKPDEAIPEAIMATTSSGLPSSEAVVQLLEKTMRSFQSTASDSMKNIVLFLRPYLHDKSQGEIIFFSSIVLAVLLFVVIIPAYEMLVHRAKEDDAAAVEEIIIGETSNRVVGKNFVRSSTSSVSSMDTIEESEEEHEDEEIAAEIEVKLEVNPVEAVKLQERMPADVEEKEKPSVEEKEKLTAEVKEEEEPPQLVDSQHVDEAQEDSLSTATQEAIAPTALEDVSVSNENIEDSVSETACGLPSNEFGIENELVQIDEQKSDPEVTPKDDVPASNSVSTPEADTHAASLPSTTTNTSDDESILIAPMDTPTSSPPGSPADRSTFKKKMSFGSFKKNPMGNPVKRLSVSMRRISSSKSVSSMK